jgi:hypothetical protein
MMDARLLREAVNGDEGAGVIDKVNETISTQYKLLKQKLKIPDDGSEEGSVEGSGLVKDQMRRALQFMSLSRGGAGSDGTGSEAAHTRNDASSDGNSYKGGGGGSRSGGRSGGGGGGGGRTKAAGLTGKGSNDEHAASAASRAASAASAGSGMDVDTLRKLKKKQVCCMLLFFFS